MELKRLSNIKLKLGESENALYEKAHRALKKKPSYFRIVKKSLDARDKDNLFYVYTIEFSADDVCIKQPPLERLAKEKLPPQNRPVLVVGSGPAGLFCALRLLKRGIVPVLIERGEPIDDRVRTLNAFHLSGVLNTESNVSFGEGGAGTFSDGKLNTGTHVRENDEVLSEFIKFGAPQEIAYLNKPHIGSDKLRVVVKNMREYLMANGVKVYFNAKLTDLIVKDGVVTGAEIRFCGKEKQPTTQRIDVSAVVLAIGHSARDTFETLRSRGVSMKKKDFAVGVRIEHLQSSISKSQYGARYGELPPADYKCVFHGDRAAFTFCMCPGGYVMAAASEEGGVVTNGMSNYARDGVNANSALIVQVTSADYPQNDPLASVEYQRRIERAAYAAAGGSYLAPVQRAEDFLKGRCSSNFGEVQPTYPRGTAFVDLSAVLPTPVADELKRAIVGMDKKLHGFAHPDALLTAAETRTSSPVRIERDETLQSTSHKGLFPCGEGAGYAGGITSSAADGIRVADAVFQSLSL